MTTTLEPPPTQVAIAVQPLQQSSGLLERSPALVAVISFDGRILLANRAWTDLLGHASELVVGRLVSQFVHADHAAAFTTMLRESAESGASRGLDASVRCHDGTHQWFSWKVRRDANRGLFAIAFDVSDRKEAELRSERRAYVTSLRAEIWAPFARTVSANSILEAWANVLAKSLEAIESAIWTVDERHPDPVFGAASHNPQAGQSLPFFELLIDEVRQVRSTKAPSAFVSAGGAAPGDVLEKIIRARGIVGILLYPIILQDRVVAIVAACFGRAIREVDRFTLETASNEIGPALAFLRHHDLLAESKRAYDALVRSAPTAICCVGRDGNVTRWNPAAECLFGRPAAEALGRPLVVARNAERELLEAAVQGALAGQATAHVETKVQSQRGQPLDVGLSVSPLCSPDKTIEGALIVFADLTERKRAERRLALEHALTRVLTDRESTDQALSTVLSLIGTHLGWSCAEFWTADGGSSPVRLAATWNSSATSAVEFENQTRNWDGSEPADLARNVLRHGKPLWFAKLSFDRSVDRAGLAARCGLEDALGIPVASSRGTKGVMLFFSEQIPEPDEQLLSCLTAIAEQIGAFGSRLGLQQSLQESVDKLRQAEKMEAVGRLVGGVAHDFNNLLTVILGYGELLLGEVAGDAPIRESLTEIVESGKRASGLTRQLLAFCRKEIYNPVVLDLNAHVEGMEKMLRRLVGEAIELRTTLAPDLGHVLADPAQIEQIVMNLIVNARDAMPTGGQITIETKMVQLARGQKAVPHAPPGSYVLLSVGDTGCGMEEATRIRIFEPFFTTKGAGKGTGMGLATVQEIVQQCGGQIAVESRLGQGSTFQIFLPPVTSGLAAWEIDAAPQAIPRGSETILIVEDETPVRRLMARLLRVQNYQVHEVANATDALTLLRKQGAKIGLLLADVVLPDMNGVALAESAQKMQSNLKVLFVSGYRDGELRRLGMPDLGSRLLQKPFTTFDLAVKVRQTLDG
jgi:two-component system, cell cycle sensor histidine kinase and response regulator CckA